MKILNFRNTLGKIVFFLPILTVLISVITVILAYSIAKDEQENLERPSWNCTLHNDFPPYISEVGDCKPQSSVFTFGMVLSGCVTLVIILIRYFQVRNYFTGCDRVNTAALVFGITLVVGKFMVVSFQLSSHKVLHYFGACGYFGGSFLFCCCQAAISSHHSKHHVLCVIRTICAIGMFCTGFLFSLFLLPTLEGKYSKYNIAPISEWAFAALKMLFMLSFCGDFKNILPILDARRNSYEELCNGKDCQVHPWCDPNKEYDIVEISYGLESQV